MISIFLYGSGLVALYLADLLITSTFRGETISAWAEIRALIGLSGILCLVGLDLVIMRSPQSSARLLRLLAVQVPLLALPVALVVHGLGYLESFLQAYFLAVASAGTIALYQYFRSHHQRSLAQLTQQGWRVVILGIIVGLVFVPEAIGIGTAVVAVMLAGVALAISFAFVKRPSRFCVQKPEPVSALYRIGARFMVTSSLLALAVYAEQLLVIQVGTTEDSARYFTHATFFLFPINVLNGYAGFLLGPWVRDNHDRFIAVLHRWWPMVIFGLVGVVLVLNGIGHAGWRIMSPSVGAPSLGLSLIFAACGVMISLYQIPSAYNGVFAQPKHHDALIVAQLVSLACAFGVFLLLNTVLATPVVISVAMASLVNWTLRSGSGMAIVALIARNRIA
ncbi:hypothetical protein [Litoreibacter albidus]|uniref:hypothetical protein n=1 Tax=Litoreibacter albidus TaxID=670155 RepID=UPI003736BEBD